MKSSKPKQVAAALDYSHIIYIINHSFSKPTGIHPREEKLSLEESLVPQSRFTSINSLFGKHKAEMMMSECSDPFSVSCKQPLNSPGVETEFSE